MAYFVYILRCADKTLYTGTTGDLKKRLKDHNAGRGAKYTRGRKPVQLLYHKDCQTKSAALKEEHRIKKLSRLEKLNLVV